MHTTNEQLYQVILLALSILAGITGYFIVSLVRQKNNVARWQEARIKAEIDTLENERKRIAEDLHDDIGPMLSAIKLQVDFAEPATEEDKDILDKSVKQMGDVIKRFREISYNLLPSTLVRRGFVKATQEFVGKMNEAHKVQIEFFFDNEPILKPENKINLYRIIQEIIHNTIKHADAKNLVINLETTLRDIKIFTSDNGKGFIYSPDKDGPTGLGLLNIQSRAAVLNAKLTINTQPGAGTKYLLLMPSDYSEE